MKKRIGEIYVLTCKITRLQYVGKALKTSAEKRWDGHIAAALGGRSKMLIHKAIRKYGVENFTAEVVGRYSADRLNAAERRWVKKLGTLVPGGYNLTEGGEGSWGFKHRPSTCRKMSASALKVWKDESHRTLMSDVHTGFKVTNETRAKISDTLMGHPVTEEMRTAQSLQNKITLANDPIRLARIKGGLHCVPHTDAAKEKMRQAALNMWARRRAA